MIMDGNTMDVGSVGFVSKFRSVSKLARAVMEYTSHTLLVGNGAEEFAEMIGFVPQNTTTEESTAEYLNWKENNCQPNFYTNLDGSTTSCPPYQSPDLDIVKPKVHRGWASKDQHDTIGMVAIDSTGSMACGTSTNGANHKVRRIHIVLCHTYMYVCT
jgi:N4-(beta-N-acetylglucosaminyl)-L-asparaginase